MTKENLIEWFEERLGLPVFDIDVEKTFKGKGHWLITVDVWYDTKDEKLSWKTYTITTTDSMWVELFSDDSNDEEFWQGLKDKLEAVV